MRLRYLLLATLALLLAVPLARSATTCAFTTVDTTWILDGDCWTDQTIAIPNGFTLDGANHTITAQDPSGDHFQGAVVKNGGTTVHIKNLKITASALVNVCDGPGPPDNRLRGILFESADGSITKTIVENINQGVSGCQEGNGIEVRNPPFDGTHPGTKTVTISGNTVTNYQKNGITANGDVAATITDNVVTGAGPVLYIAQNGIQLGYGATGIVMDNQVAGSWYTGADWSATGLLVFEANDAMVHRNQVSGSQVGVAIETWCWNVPTASENRVVQNTITGAEWGVTVASLDFPGYSNCQASADNNKVTNNTITGASTGGNAGIALGPADYDLTNTLVPVTYNNKVIRNNISGFNPSIDEFGSASKVRANVDGP
ncbi:MAG: right-handed parallel beta-helix repeat-containing protein [Terriglobia bacterium]